MARPKLYNTENEKREAHKEACKRWYNKNGKEYYANREYTEGGVAGKPSKKVYVYNTDMELLYVFPSSAEAARIMSLSQGNISNCARGSLPTYRGLIFSYEELNNKLERIYTEQDGEELKEKRLASINKACKKIYWADPEKGRAKGRLYAQKHKMLKKKRKNGNACS